MILMHYRKSVKVEGGGGSIVRKPGIGEIIRMVRRVSVAEKIYWHERDNGTTIDSLDFSMAWLELSSEDIWLLLT